MKPFHICYNIGMMKNLLNVKVMANEKKAIDGTVLLYD